MAVNGIQVFCRNNVLNYWATPAHPTIFRRTTILINNEWKKWMNHYEKVSWGELSDKNGQMVIKYFLAGLKMAKMLLPELLVIFLLLNMTVCALSPSTVQHILFSVKSGLVSDRTLLGGLL